MSINLENKVDNLADQVTKLTQTVDTFGKELTKFANLMQQGFEHLNTKIDDSVESLRAELKAEIQDTKLELSRKIDGVSKRLDAGIIRSTDKQSNLNSRLLVVEEKVLEV